ncbi:type 1 glutamine amidotransferase domain-containing protein [Fulvivirga lutea]|uniref:Type 1 glutamine amidotransferase domain-containing protein n=1 Tax=Fulvivirga lutea TaxID=2810512 RepID=A0A974ZZP4_9BACT|nr:type 1 glutamine amidotransferase domain-containing protein [Fulvivirga lutea]QSE96474.1 type 1 glutamine amidotransferase domain-containing protein [Fulvivirga lutea]
MKVKKIIKWSLGGIATFIILLVGFGFWFISLIKTDASEKVDYSNITPQEIPYLSEDSIRHRGRILAVVTSIDKMGTSGKGTGFEFTELSRAYYVFIANGFEVDVASPKGGEAPVVMDDMGMYDYAFLNDKVAQYKIKNTIPISNINSKDYEAIYFVGGKGTMFDFPDNAQLQSVVRDLYESDKVIGAVCHGPAALVNVQLSNGDLLIKDKKVSGFTNAEELLLISDAREIFPFLLQDKLSQNGAQFIEGAKYLENVVVDGRVVTGQNPWSTWLIAESMIKQMGYEPKAREITGEENAEAILSVYETYGYERAVNKLEQLKSQTVKVNKALIGGHSLIAIWQLQLGRAYDMVGLLRRLN